MGKLFNIEVLKSTKNRTFWTLLIFHFLLITTSSFFLKKIIDNFKLITPGGGVMVKSGIDVYLFFPNIWHTLTFVSGYFNILLSCILIISISNEFSNKTLRQNILNGLTRWQFLKSKIILSICLAFYTSVLVFILGLIIGFIQTEYLSVTIIFSELYFIAYLFLELIIFQMFAIFLVFIFKSAALTINILFFYISVIEKMLTFFIPGNFGKYFPHRAISGLIPPPDHLLNEALRSSNTIFMMALLYGFIFLVTSYIIIKNKDL